MITLQYFPVNHPAIEPFTFRYFRSRKRDRAVIFHINGVGTAIGIMKSCFKLLRFPDRSKYLFTSKCDFINFAAMNCSRLIFKPNEIIPFSLKYWESHVGCSVSDLNIV